MASAWPVYWLVAAIIHEAMRSAVGSDASCIQNKFYRTVEIIICWFADVCETSSDTSQEQIPSLHGEQGRRAMQLL
jgi:hypothetical protein